MEGYGLRLYLQIAKLSIQNNGTTFQRKTWAVIFTAFMLVGLLSIGIYYLLGMLDMADTIQLPATIGAWFILSLIASSVVSHITTHPLIQMYKAINHLTADSSAPQPEHTLLGYKLVKTMIQDVYKLAGGQTDTATKLQSSQEFLQTILNSTSVPIIALNRNGQISYYNHAALNMMPQTTDNPIGSRLEDLIDITYAKDDLNEWLKTAQTDKISDLGIFRAVQVKMRDGKHYVSIAANYNKNESHNIETLLAFFDESEIYGQRAENSINGA